MTIAKTILAQLGGNRFVLMTGAKSLLDIGKGLQFSIGRNSSRCNRVKITLDANDTYTVEFGRYSPKNFEYTVLKTVTDVYCDMLQDIFTETTGLYTSM